MRLLFHTDGWKACHGPALWMVKDQSSAYEMPADNFEKLDGSKPVRGEFVICGSCGEPLDMQLLTRNMPSESLVRQYRDRRFAFVLPLIEGSLP